MSERRSLAVLDGSGAQVLANPIRYDSNDGASASAGRSHRPALGADTDEVLADVGLLPDDIDRLRRDGVIE